MARRGGATTAVTFAATCMWDEDERGEPCRPCNTHGRWAGTTRLEAIHKGEKAGWVFIINPDRIEALCPRHADPSDQYASHGQLYDPRLTARQHRRMIRSGRRRRAWRKVRRVLFLLAVAAVLLYLGSR
jgi:hypothetical protein